MGRKVIYWVATGLLALSSVFAGVNYLWGQQAAQGFVHLEYPQQLRVLLRVRQAPGRDHAHCSRPSHAQRVGLRGVHVRVDCGGGRTLFG